MNCLSLRACYLFFECDNVFFNLENYRFYKKEAWKGKGGGPSSICHVFSEIQQNRRNVG